MKPAAGSAIRVFLPKDDLIAFVDHPIQGDDSGSLAVVDLAGKKKIIVGRVVHDSGRGLVAEWKGNLVHRQQVGQWTARYTRSSLERQRAHGSCVFPVR